MASGSAAFSAAINADAPAFGLTPQQALEYAEINESLQRAMKAVTDPATRTPVAVSQKNTVMKSMQRRAKALCDIIRATPAVSDAQLISLGLLPRPRRTRREAPTDPPMVRIDSVVGRVVNVRVFDKGSASARSKPFAARGAEIYSYVGEAPPTEARAYHYECFASRTTAQITMPQNIPSGASVWISARWLSARGEASIASSPISATLQGGAIGAAAPHVLRQAA